MISFKTENTEEILLDNHLIIKWIKIVSAKYGKKTGIINYLFCNDKKILETNRQFLQHDYYTDIITFDYTVNDTISGDIFISLDTVKSNAAELGIEYENEIKRVIIHGILHLCGFKDKTPEDALNMREREKDSLEILEKLEN